MALAAARDARLVVSHLGLWTPALYALRKLGHVDHFFHLSAALRRLRFPRLRSDLRFAEATEADLAEILGGLGSLDADSRREVITRVRFHRSGVPGCHVGRNDRGEVVSLQWLIRPRDNEALSRACRGLYYRLQPDEVMIENLFVFPAFRGLGTFETVNHFVLERARSEGFRLCHTYVRKDNVVSLNGCLDLGFRIRKLLTGYSVAGVTWRAL
ncbi:MAG TPA: hypothetical protein VGK67_09080 [Myxococcales bacterium]|jgi:predicted GNAT family acetyltransferase